ncbi:hypothetical protein HDF16_000649 [Granulicella aggregans]|uniref:Dolichyl-phosphate-mannose-protein mannosyltransferase n=1 Tax=Granulicella aggregans TaxID=474949 RepID=A0A7W7Z9X5_9BACT|nr:hypothetical protein [Granulicella aggregans]MBB5055980.1 hypothetical protein [Granulicella aggregans]
MYYLILCLWALCLSVAWIGTGWQIMRLLDFAEIAWPISGLVGLSTFIFVGGFLNLAGLVNRPSLIAMVVLGDILFLATLPSYRVRMSEFWVSFRQQPWYVRGLAVVCIGALIASAVGTLTYSRFSRFDDLSSYLTSPGKLIQLGSLPYDPFSERRVQSGLGANFFLQAFMLVAGDLRSIWFIDAGAGLALFAGCMYEAGRKLGNTVTVSLGLAWLVLIMPLSHLNLTMTTLPAAIFTALFLLETADKTAAASRSVLLGLLAAAVTLLKSTYLPMALLLLFCLHLMRLRERSWVRVAREALLSAFSFLAVLIPWMLDLKRKEGTLLFPLLGKGFEIAAYGPVPHRISPGIYPAVAGLTFLITFAVVAASHWITTRGLPYADKVSMLIFAGGFVVLPISIATAGSALSRYTRPFLLPFALILLASIARIPGMGRSIMARRLTLSACAAMLILGPMAFGRDDKNFMFFKYMFKQRETALAWDGSFYGLTGDVLRRERDRQLKLQSTIPPGQAVYASLLPTFAMDFRRNNIYVADFPGMSSLPPGMPTRGAPAALRSYLLSKSVRYIAYSRKLTAETDEVLNGPPPKRGDTWPQMELLNSADVDRQILALSETSRVIYDDGDEQVIDLL